MATFKNNRIITCRHCGAKYNKETVDHCMLCFGGKDLAFARKAQKRKGGYPQPKGLNK